MSNISAVPRSHYRVPRARTVVGHRYANIINAVAHSPPSPTVSMEYIRKRDVLGHRGIWGIFEKGWATGTPRSEEALTQRHAGEIVMRETNDGDDVDAFEV